MEGRRWEGGGGGEAGERRRKCNGGRRRGRRRGRRYVFEGGEGREDETHVGLMESVELLDGAKISVDRDRRCETAL